MDSITLIIGNKRYSSWSLRAWLALKLTGQPFKEKMIWFDQPGTRAEMLASSPSGKVPCLVHGSRVVWDTLSIGEYLAETFPGAQLWPADKDARALARSVVAEMHSGFGKLRANMSMDLLSRKPGQGRAEGVQDDIDRIEAIWSECRARFGKGGDFLFGAPTLADCFYAPVATRFRTFEVALGAVATAYSQTIFTWPLFREWEEASRSEPYLPNH